MESGKEFEIELGLSRDVAEGLNGLEVRKDFNRGRFFDSDGGRDLGESGQTAGDLLTLFGFLAVIEGEGDSGEEGKGGSEPNELEACPKRRAAGVARPRIFALDGLKDQSGKVGRERGVRELAEGMVEGAFFVEASAQGWIGGEGAVEIGLVAAGKRSTNGIQDVVVFVGAVHRFGIENRGLRKVAGINRSMRRF